MLMGVIGLLIIAIFVITVLFYVKARKHSGGSSSSSYCCPPALTTGATGCLVISERTGCDTFQLRMLEVPGCGPCAAPLLCPRGVLTVKKPLPLDELILTASVPTGLYVTDIYAQIVPALCGAECARRSDFPLQTGPAVDLTVGYTHFALGCTGGTNTPSVTLALPTGINAGDHAFLSVVIDVADSTCATDAVSPLTIEGRDVPHGAPCMRLTRPVLTPGTCQIPTPRYSRIKIPTRCCNPL